MNTLKISNFLLVLLFSGSCKDKEPAPTETERFYCEIDGERYRPNNNGDIFNEVLIADWYKTNSSFTVSAYNSVNYKDFLMYLKLEKNILEPKYYKVDSTNANATYLGGYIKINGNFKKEVFRVVKTSGFIEITKVDTLNRRVSGKFEYDVRSIVNTSKIVKIRKGQFNNLRY